VSERDLPLKNIREAIRGYFQRSTRKKLLGMLLYYVAICLIVYSTYGFRTTQLEPDAVAPRTIQSAVQATVASDLRTEALRQEAEAMVQKSYQADPSALENARRQVTYYFDHIEEALGSDADGQLDEIIQLLQSLPGELSAPYTAEALTEYLRGLSPEERTYLREVTLQAVEDVMNKTITADTLAEVKSGFLTQIPPGTLDMPGRVLAELIGRSTLAPTLIYDEAATLENRAKARDAIQPVYITIKAEEIIVRAGERVTAEQIELLEKLGIQQSSGVSWPFLGVMLFVALISALVLAYIRRFYPDIYNSDKHLLLLALLVVLFLLLSRFIMALSISANPQINMLSAYLSPAPAAVMLITILINDRLAYFVSMFFAFMIGLISPGNQLHFAIVIFAGSITSIFRISRLSQISDLIKIGLAVALVNVSAILSLSLINADITWEMGLSGMFMGAVGGILSAVLTIGALPFLENAFSITSTMRLLELSNPNHPLLKKLFLEAPGTYHHSLMVGSLAESTAELIGADSLLTRVGAYYHDIGKMKRPEYYVENQRGDANPHEHIAPALSAVIVLSHVKEGLELARENRLPPEIIAFIATHHGTSLTEYFYNKAVREDGRENVNPADFRYPGPLPRSKETALVMLADSTEAAVRSLADPSKDKIKLMVHNIIKSKLANGQLDESDLTLKYLDVITDQFCLILEGVYHKRIAYPGR
jgi:putative nucleotidyltransferase with HDIG domain